MCGITGYISLNNSFSLKSFFDANTMIRHRGPDDKGYFFIDKGINIYHTKKEDLNQFNFPDNEFLIALGFRRLSIIDLSDRGAQPFYDEKTNTVIIFNGEIYNYLELRGELLALGHKFRSDTDTEVILKAYREWGSKCLSRFNGMWAFCLIDLQNYDIILSRDRLGIKPMYYFYDGNNFIFGSEAKQILKMMPHTAGINEAVLFDYLLQSYGHESDETFFKDVYKLPAGSFFKLKIDKKILIEKNEFWRLPEVINEENRSLKDYADEFVSLFEDSIKLRLRSDVPVGTCLSGGLDSSGIACMVKRIQGNTSHKLFTIQSINKDIDETHYAQQVIDATGFESIMFKPGSFDMEIEFPKFVWHQDEPLLTASIFGGYHVYKLAKESGVTVVLDGQGVDELLGGYEIGVHTLVLQELLKKGKFNFFIDQLNKNSDLYKKSKIAINKNVISGIVKDKFKSLVPNYTKLVSRSTAKDVLYKWIHKDFIEANLEKSHMLNKNYEPEMEFSSEFKRRSYLLTRHTNLPGILRQVDRNSMAFSVESRVPFLDYRIVEFFYKIPVEYIMKDGYTKYIYREAMKGIIPNAINNRIDKRGFAMPEREWLSTAIPQLDNLISGFENDSIINVDYLKNNFKRMINNPNDYQNILWRLINTLVWRNIFFSGLNKRLFI